MPSYQYVFVMQNLSKVFPGGKELFKGITLSFLPGAKIGVLGVNGAGKSTLLKIMAGVDKEFGGEAWAADGVKVGYLEQEPKLDVNKTVMENVMDGVGQVRDLLKEFEEISLKFSEPMSDDEMNALIEKQAELSEKIDACNGWDLERNVEIAMDALRCPDKDGDVTKLSGGEKNLLQLAKLAVAYASATCPKVTVICGHAIGASFVLLGSKALGADLVYATDSSEIGALVAESGVAFAWDKYITEETTRESLVEDWKTSVSSPVCAASSGEIDDIISVNEMRARICSALLMLAAKGDVSLVARRKVLPL